MRSTLLFFLAFVISIAGCGSEKESALATPESPPTPTIEGNREPNASGKKDCVDYEPAVVELHGKLTVQTFFGPPNFGENPETDSKEDQPVLSLDEPINVCGKTEHDEAYESPSVGRVKDVTLVFQVPSEAWTSHKAWIGKKVVVAGTLFHADTGHHHTDILMSLQSISLAKGAKD